MNFFQTMNNFIRWQRVPAGLIRFRALETETFFLLTYAVLYIFSGYVIGLIILRFPLPIMGATQFNQDIWYSVLFKIVLLLIIPSAIYFLSWKYTINDLLLGIKPTIGNITATILMVTAGFFLNATHLQLIRDHLHSFPDALLRMALGIIMPLFTAALPEELFFRGFLQTRLEKSWGRIMAILVTVILFTAWHLPSRYLLSSGIEGQAGDFAQVLLHTGLPVFIIGLIFAAHWSRYRNIILLILTHWAIDILPSVSSYFKISF
jgi:uncharacterized protein